MFDKPFLAPRVYLMNNCTSNARDAPIGSLCTEQATSDNARWWQGTVWKEGQKFTNPEGKVHKDQRNVAEELIQRTMNYTRCGHDTRDWQKFSRASPSPIHSPSAALRVYDGSHATSIDIRTSHYWHSLSSFYFPR